MIYYTTLYKGLEHLWILIFAGVLELTLCKILRDKSGDSLHIIAKREAKMSTAEDQSDIIRFIL